jgi:hypothetical protein
MTAANMIDAIERPAGMPAKFGCEKKFAIGRGAPAIPKASVW